MQFPNPSPTNEGFEGDASPMGLHARGYGYCETANEPRDPKAFCLRKVDDLEVGKAKGYGGGEAMRDNKR
jgi:hypothetical protein